MTAQTTDVLVIGAGFSGIAMGHALLGAGRDDFVILEKASTPGGTWRDNRYPGCACDVPSHLYSMSFDLNPDWQQAYASQPEIQAYLLGVIERHGLSPHIQTDVRVQHAAWDDHAGHWVVTTTAGTWHARAVFAGTGPLHEPRIPRIEGLDSFRGRVFHTARWPEDVDLAGKRVAVVGTGSSAIQLVPHVQAQAKEMVLFQRTPAWVLPKFGRAIGPGQRAAFRTVPGLMRAYRAALFYGLELVQLAQRRPGRMRPIQALAHRNLRRQISDPVLRERLTPTFTIGCKRFLLSNDYYPALAADNATVTGAVVSATPNGLVDSDGVEHAVDVVVMGTGFKVHNPPIADAVQGRHGQTLAQAWQGSPRAYLGTTTHGFPNFFLSLGPNTGNGHTSVLTAAEAQAGYLVATLDVLDARGATAVDVRSEAEDAWNDSVQQALSKMVWNAGGCASWYLDAQGMNRSIYPWSTIDLRRRLKRFRADDYAFRAADGTWTDAQSTAEPAALAG